MALAGLLHGLPINSAQNYTGSFWDLLQPYALFTGVTLVLVCLLHGATFLCLKTTGDMRERSWQVARRVAPFTAAAVIGFVIWTHVTASTTFFLNVIELLAVLAVLAAVWLVYDHREGFAFAATTVTIASCILAIFVDLYPNVMVSSTNPAYNLTVHNTASGGYSLKVMTVVVDHLPAGGARLPDLDLLRVPAARQPAGIPAASAIPRSRARAGADTPAYRSPGPAGS